ncbi:MAG: hypothetical protein NTX45_02985 [Proteobacteria bacterium]|nr:hypothetical protein [Pseudomonadota bacterium]
MALIVKPFMVRQAHHERLNLMAMMRRPRRCTQVLEARHSGMDAGMTVFSCSAELGYDDECAA